MRSYCPCPLSLTTASASVRTAAHVCPSIARIGSIGRWFLPCCHLGAFGKRQDDQESRELLMQVHCAEIGLIRLGWLFFALRFEQRVEERRSHFRATRERNPANSALGGSIAEDKCRQLRAGGRRKAKDCPAGPVAILAYAKRVLRDAVRRLGSHRSGGLRNPSGCLRT
jgi:hypothetical protein